jgi:hypothetical protein
VKVSYQYFLTLSQNRKDRKNATHTAKIFCTPYKLPKIPVSTKRNHIIKKGVVMNAKIIIIPAMNSNTSLMKLIIPKIKEDSSYEKRRIR